jgi:polar amino acid transport system substrate-binding protein
MANDKLKIAISPAPPFIIESNGKYSGFEIELWEAIAKQIGNNFEYEKHNFQELIPLVADKKADIALAAITINEEREKIIDFSHQTFNSGLRILLSKKRAEINIASTIKLFFKWGSKQLIKPLLILTIIVILFGNILWFAERTTGAFVSSYFPGVFQATWLSLSAILGSPTINGLIFYEPHSWIGRIIIQLEYLTGLVVLVFLVGGLTAFITTKKIRLNIQGPRDLRGKIVATVQGTTSEIILKNLGAIVIPLIKIEEAYKKLGKNEVDAVVFDAPILIYYTLNDGAEWAEVVGELFDNQDYGIVLQENSPLREEINRAILAIKENGYYDVLYKKWFGEVK